MAQRRRMGCGVIVAVVVAATLGAGKALAAERGPAAVRAAIDAIAIPAGAEPMRIDGELSEEIWTRAPPVTEFLQREPREGEAPSHATEVRVVYDRTALYVAVRARDEDQDEVVGHLTRRDEDSPSDWVRILIDSYRDRRTAYEFSVNAAGVKRDAYWFSDTNNDFGWDAVWDVAVARSPEGWRAEFRIPLSQLRFNANAGTTFGFAVMRTIAHVTETVTWPLLARSASGFVSSFGDLQGLTLDGSQKKLELAPYLLGQIMTQPLAARDPLRDSPDSDVSVGLDLKYQVAPGLTLTGTLNPDFGQVEADPAVVNLGAFETFFAERRPFFVEGSGNFSFNVDCEDGQCTGLFYSRRIGRAPQRFVGAPVDGFSWQPTNSTIYGAAKLSGRIGDFAIGALGAVTAREVAAVASGPRLDVTHTPVEPAAAYSVVRVSRDFADSSRLSMMVTGTQRRLSDELLFLPGSAVTAGVDGDWRIGSGLYSVRGLWAGSLVRGSEAAIDRLQRSNVHSYQRPDAGHVTYDPTRTSLSGHAGSASFQKIGGRRLRFSASYGFKTPGFDINDLGFLSRADDINVSHWVQLRDDQPGRFVRNQFINFNQWAGWNFDGDRRFMGGNVNAHWTFTNNWNAGTGITVNAGGFADRLTRGGPGGYTPGNVNQWGFISTDNRRLASFNLNLSWFNDREESWSYGISPGVTLRPASALFVSANVNVNRNRPYAQWITNLDDGGDPHYVFGRLHQTTVGISARVNYTIRPTLTLQIYAQPFVSAGDYDDFKELVDGRAGSQLERYDPFAYAGNPDFTFRSFRTTNVLRWEYLPGSTLFVVWQQGRQITTDDGQFSFGRDVGAVFDAPASNVFLVKISRWMNF